MPWWKALAELVDNAIDAGASQIKIAMKGRVLTVSDDGRGAPDVVALFRMGKHQEHSGLSGIGTYGIGCKDAWLSCADEMTVTTIHKGVKSTLKADRRNLIARNWNADDPITQATDEPSGTSIVLPLRPRKNPPSNDAFSELAAVFTPALLNGVQILRSGQNGERKALKPVLMPVRENCIVESFEVDGKQVHIDIGILPDGTTVDRGPFWLVYKHRVIERGTSRGVGSYSVRRIAGIITLGDGWRLSKHKDDLTDYEEELSEELFRRIEPVLQQAESVAEAFELQGLRGELEATLNDMLLNAASTGKKEKRKPRESNNPGGGIKPKGSSRRRRRASKIHENETGGIITQSFKGKLFVDFEEKGEQLLGRYDSGGRRVFLNRSHPFISSVVASKNSQAMLACAVALVVDYECRHEGSQAVLSFEYESFAEAMGKLIHSVGGKNGK